VDIVGAIKSAPLVDLAIVIGLFAFLFVGVLQGAFRRLLGIAGILLAFLIAANSRDSVGDWLAGNWTQFDLGYNRLIAFVVVFVALSVAAAVLIQIFYKRIELSPDHPIVDDVVGGILGVVEGLVLLTLAVIILNSYPLPPAQAGDISLLRQAQDMLVNQSHIADGLRSGIVPPLVHVLSVLLPSDLVSVFP
jgi:uncharacterized membrane protein required for colicin V production